MGEDEKLFTDGEAYERRMGRWSHRGEDAVAAAEYDVKALAAGQKTVRSENLPHGKITMIPPSSQPATTIPADDPERNFTLARSDEPNLPHIGLVGDTYTIHSARMPDTFVLSSHEVAGGGKMTPPPCRTGPGVVSRATILARVEMALAELGQ